jgi:hypothetical protein
MNRRALLLFPLLAPLCAMAQTIADRPVELVGPTSADRRITGLADAGMENDALNARTAQAAGFAYGVASGGNAWSISVMPAITALVPGMRLHVLVQASNTGPVTLQIDALAPWPVRKNGTLELEAGDLADGEVAAVIFDGSAFQLVNARRRDRRDCPGGSVAVNELYCIETAQRDTATFFNGGALCASLGGRLCSWGEWFAACSDAVALGLADMVGDWEWTNNAANSDHSARVVGQSSCSQSGTTDTYTFSRAYRCCYKR